MPSLINRVPPGLLSLLGIKSLGVNPSLLADMVQPVLELRDLYYGVYAQEAIHTITAPAAPGIHVSNLAGPGPGEIWLVERMSIFPTVVLPAGTTYGNVSPMMYNQGTAVAHALDSGTLITITAGQTGQIGSSRFILPTNYRLGAFIGSVTLGTATAWYISVRYTVVSV